MSKFTAALVVIGAEFEGHITLCFCDAYKGGKVSTLNSYHEAEVSGIAYWEHVDLTVLLVRSEYVNERHNYYKESGYTYDHEFIPHITVGKGNLVSDYKKYLGCKFHVGGEYVRIY